MNTKHTPTPWFAQHRTIQDGKGGSQRWHILAGADRSIQICEMPGWDEDDEANANLVVRAVNSHADLLAALEKLAAESLYARGFLNMSDPEAKGVYAALETAENQARAAIAKAKGPQPGSHLVDADWNPKKGGAS